MTIKEKQEKLRRNHARFCAIQAKIKKDGFSTGKQTREEDRLLQSSLNIIQKHFKEQEDMLAKRKSTRSKRASYSKSPKTIYKDGKNTIQVVIRKTKVKKSKKSKK